ncbi:MAG: DUF1289 domain-containing protein [Candidatus Dadabacteria bacterium]|nr:DUF1289 domain-containing protein [Candidatus Dadabacteria bacterium]NIX14960.1 DUF1289 domain-containing protein [Candidatus Dadabacteria bacterium]
MIYRESSLSPCKSVCVLDDDKQMCKTCFRTITEIANWSRYSKDEKLEVLQKIELRTKSAKHEK